MSKKVNLAEAFKVDASELQPKPDVVEIQGSAGKSEKPKKRHIGGHFDESVYRQLKILGAEKDMTTQEMLAEALNGFFVVNDKPPIA